MDSLRSLRGQFPRRDRRVRLPAFLLLGWIASVDATETPVGPSAVPFDDSNTPIGEVIIEAPEPRYVAPTRRDRIGRIWAPVYINDQGPFRLVLDTGSSHAAVNAAVAASLGIDLTNQTKVLLRGVTGSRVVPTITVDSLVVGDLQLRAKRLPIVVDALGGADGVLGTEGLLDKRIFIDFRNDRITIARSKNERAPAGYKTIPVKIVQGLLVANVRVGRMRATAIIDTGGQSSIANQAFRMAIARRLKPEDILVDVITGATLDVQRGDRLITPPIQLGDIIIQRARITTDSFNAIPGMGCVAPRAAFYAMPFVSLPPGRSDEDYVLALLRATGILCVYGSGFGMPPEQGTFRIVYLADPAELSKIYAEIGAFTRDYLERAG